MTIDSLIKKYKIKDPYTFCFALSIDEFRVIDLRDFYIIPYIDELKSRNIFGLVKEFKELKIKEKLLFIALADKPDINLIGLLGSHRTHRVNVIIIYDRTNIKKIDPRLLLNIDNHIDFI